MRRPFAPSPNATHVPQGLEGMGLNRFSSGKFWLQGADGPSEPRREGHLDSLRGRVELLGDGTAQAEPLSTQPSAGSARITGTAGDPGILQMALRIAW